MKCHLQQQLQELFEWQPLVLRAKHLPLCTKQLQLLQHQSLTLHQGCPSEVPTASY